MSGSIGSGSGPYLLLEDGTMFPGAEGGVPGEVVGEVVFQTAMTGYQEAVTDPSFRRQIVVFTYPLIGNYGTDEEWMESERVHARGVVMREAKNRRGTPGSPTGWLDFLGERNVPGLTGVDTRSLVRHIRTKGAMRGGIFEGRTPVEEALGRVRSEPSMEGLDLAAEVTPSEVRQVGDRDSADLEIAVVDTGVKRSILENFIDRGCSLTLFPYETSAAEILASRPDAVLLANGPGDPAALDRVADNVRDILGKVPVFGICMGHQLLARAIGLETFKLKFGHRGVNHPVKDLKTGRIEITSQNHGFAVVGPDGATALDVRRPVRWSTDFGEAELTHVNVYDRTVEGLRLLETPAATVQYHPEASPGPHDSLHLFDRFVEMAKEGSFA